MGGVIVSPNIKRERVRIDPAGNIINPATKQIIHPVVQDTPPVAPQAPTPIVNAPSSPLSIQQQIDEAKANLAKLEELKKLKIAQMKAEIELLEQ